MSDITKAAIIPDSRLARAITAIESGEVIHELV